MSKFLTQLKNDLRLNKRTLLNPLIIFVILDILAIIAFFIFKFHTGLSYNEMINLDIEAQMEISSPEFMKLAWRMIGMGAVGIAGFIMVIVGLSMGGSALNLDHFRKCEIFYRAQPVSVWQYAGSKFLVVVLGPAIIMIVIGIINLTLLIPFLAPVIKVSIIQAFWGILSSSLLYLRSLIVVGSIGFLASAIFREKALQKLVMFIFALQLAMLFCHIVMGIEMIDIVHYLFMLINPLQDLVDFSNLETAENINEILAYFNISRLFFNWHTLLQIAASAVFFTGGVFIYSRKEIN